MTVEPSLALGVCLLVLLGLAVAWSAVGQLRLGRSMVVAGVRAAAQLAAVALVIVVALTNVFGSIALAVVMFGIAVFTTARRCGLGRRWPWAALAMAIGVIPVLVIIFVSGTVPPSGVAIIPICGIVIGNAMTGHTLLCRRVFDHLRDEHGLYEAGLSVGLNRSQAITEVIQRRVPEALVPNLDQTRTAGIVTLPGAFVGVLLGGGSPIQAAAAQVLVLLGLMAGQAGTVVSAARFVAAARLLPRDLVGTLRP